MGSLQQITMPMITHHRPVDKGHGEGVCTESFLVMWREYDTNDSGNLGLDQLQAFLENMNQDRAVPAADAQFVIDAAGNEHGMITPDNLADAIHVWTTICRDGGDKSYLFDKYDDDNSLSIEENEFTQLVADVCNGTEPSAQSIAETFEAISPDDAGLSKEQLRPALGLWFQRRAQEKLAQAVDRTPHMVEIASGNREGRRASRSARGRRASWATTRANFRASVQEQGDVEVCGYLEKKGSGAFGKWKRRFFDGSGHYLRYYTDEQRTLLLGAVDLSQVECCLSHALMLMCCCAALVRWYEYELSVLTLSGLGR